MKTKELLEVIEEGSSEITMGLWRAETDIHGADIEENMIFNQALSETEPLLTSHTKAILTNQIERMRGNMKPLLEKLAEHDKQFEEDARRHKHHPSEKTMEVMLSHENGNNTYRYGVIEGKAEALQTQIEYLEDVIKKM